MTASLHPPRKKMKLSIKDFFSNYDQIRRKMRIWSHLLEKSLMENFIFYAVLTFQTCKNASSEIYQYICTYIIGVVSLWDKVFKNGSSKICGRQPLKNLRGYSLLKQTTNFLKAVFHLVHT